MPLIINALHEAEIEAVFGIKGIVKFYPNNSFIELKIDKEHFMKKLPSELTEYEIKLLINDLNSIVSFMETFKVTEQLERM